MKNNNEVNVHGHKKINHQGMKPYPNILELRMESFCICCLNLLHVNNVGYIKITLPSVLSKVEALRKHHVLKCVSCEKSFYLLYEFKTQKISSRLRIETSSMWLMWQETQIKSMQKKACWTRPPKKYDNECDTCWKHLVNINHIKS